MNLTRHLVLPLDGVCRVVDAVVEDHWKFTANTGHVLYVFECGAEARVGDTIVGLSRRGWWSANCITCIVLAARRGHDY